MSGSEQSRKRRDRDDERGRDRNELLRRLTTAEYARLASGLESVPLEFKETLYEQGSRITHVYFPTAGVVSLITVLTGDDAPVETGTVGREGMVGLPTFLEASVAPGRALCQVPGSALRMAAAPFLACVKRIDSLRTLLLRYTNVLMAMIGQTAACNRAHDTRTRMARWLLMTRDRVDGDEFPMTQEFLGQMLGVRRPAVSVAGAALQRQGLIKYARGKVTIVDHEGLEKVACECYEYIRNEFGRHFGDHSRSERAAVGREEL
jgi:CRP-like cAMP-binding protein